MDEAQAKRVAAIQADIERQRPLYRNGLQAVVATVSNTIHALGVTPSTNAMLISLAEIVADAIASVPDKALRLQCIELFICYMTMAMEHYVPQFEAGQRQSAAIHDADATLN